MRACRSTTELQGRETPSRRPESLAQLVSAYGWATATNAAEQSASTGLNIAIDLPKSMIRDRNCSREWEPQLTVK